MLTKKKPVSHGFTLIELLVVMAIIALLVAMVFGVSGLAGRKSAEAKAAADLENIRTAVEEFQLSFGQFPNYTGNFSPIITNLTVADKTFLTNKVPSINLTDPWGRSYLYSNKSEYAYRLWSAGRDGSNATVDDVESGNRK